MRKNPIIISFMMTMAVIGFMPVAMMAQAVQSPAPPDHAPSDEPPAQISIQPMPVTFGRSGGKVVAELSLPQGEQLPEGANNLAPVTEVVLHSFDHIWSEKFPVRARPGGARPRDFEVELTLPGVRVPTVFTIRTVSTVKDGQEAGRVVVYPNQKMKWDADIVLLATGSRQSWFDQWMQTAGVPVAWVQNVSELSQELENLKKQQRVLLVVEASELDHISPAMQTILDDAHVNELLLYTPLTMKPGQVEVGTLEMQGPLSPLKEQRWSRALNFPYHQEPWQGLVNRQAWVTDASGLPLLELVELMQPKNAEADSDQTNTGRRQLILSYLPWDQQLGIDESADATFLLILKAAALAEMTTQKQVAVKVIQPSVKRMEPEQDQVLEAVAGREMKQDAAFRLTILDLRGNEPLADTQLLATELRDILNDANHTLLILGDDPILDQWTWLKIDRSKQAINQERFRWLGEDQWPPTREQRVKLMMELTQLGVAILSPVQQEILP